MRGVWHPNPPHENVLGYNTYWYQTNDTTDYDSTMMVFSGVTSDTVSAPLTLDSNYVKFGVEAYNAHGNSKRAETSFRSKGEFIVPSKPNLAGIGIRRD